MTDHTRIRAACRTIIGATVLANTAGASTAVEQMLTQPLFRALAMDAAAQRSANLNATSHEQWREIRDAITALEPFEGLAI